MIQNKDICKTYTGDIEMFMNMFKTGEVKFKLQISELKLENDDLHNRLDQLQ